MEPSSVCYPGTIVLSSSFLPFAFPLLSATVALLLSITFSFKLASLIELQYPEGVLYKKLKLGYLISELFFNLRYIFNKTGDLS